jgi:uncharacterized protein (TIGR03083 family)
VVSAPQEFTPAEVEALLGAYALDACTSDEVEAIEAVLVEQPELALEAERLTDAAAWVGATEALAPPPSLRDRVVQAARDRRVRAADDPALNAYVTLSRILAEVIDDLPAAVLDATTANGLTARELVVHMAAQESLLAQEAGNAVVPDVDETDIDARTAALLSRFADEPVSEAAELWRRGVDANREWAASHVGDIVNWRGVPMTRDDAIVVRAFETWIHTDDLRRVAGVNLVPPAPRHLSVMSDLAARILPLTLQLSDRVRQGKTARLVLTGEGGGDWLVAMGDGALGVAPDVTLTADVVDWCRLVGDRVGQGEFVYVVDGDAALADDLVAAAPALATL